VWLVCLFLAFGRFTPIYRLFYAVPYMDYIRAPVKFLHLVEIATAFLAGFGLDAFLRSEHAALRRKLLWLAVGLAGVLLVGTGVALSAKPAMVSHIAALGMGQFAEALGGYTVRNVVRAVVFAGLAAGVLFAVRGAREGMRVAGACVLVGLAVLDQSLVAHRYVRVIALEPFYRENVVVKALKREAGAGQVANVVNYASQNTWQDWFNMSLSMNGIRNLMPSQDEAGTSYGRLFMGLQKDPVRLWQALQARAVILPRQSGEAFFKSGVLRPVLDFELGAGTVRQAQQPGERTLTLARVVSAVAVPRFVADWQGGLPADQQAAAVIGGGPRLVSDAPQPSEAEKPGDAKIEVLSATGLPGAFATRVKVSAPCAGLLVFDERLSDSQEVLLDGKPVEKYTAGALWPSVLIPAGDHEVVLRTRRHTAAFGLGLLVSLAVAGWAFASVLSGGGRRDSGVAA
jgi:hypothetical protein